jgi:hypothetical protein
MARNALAVIALIVLAAVLAITLAGQAHAIPRGSLVLSPGSLAWTKDGAPATATV